MRGQAIVVVTGDFNELPDEVVKEHITKAFELNPETDVLIERRSGMKAVLCNYYAEYTPSSSFRTATKLKDEFGKPVFIVTNTDVTIQPSSYR